MALVTSVRPSPLGAQADDALLRKHQPILAFDQRERFYPISVESYLEGCELWHGDDKILSRPLADDLDHRWGPETHLRFVTPEERRDMFTEEVGRTARRLVSPRLGLVGLFGRIVDALFLVLVILRPTTPKASAVAAERKIRRKQLDTDPTCYSRAVLAGEWLVLHYAWFYAMNDWRSGYRGMNDHEGDWEQAWVFCDPNDHTPQWVATSNHEYAGADLRRHWTDPELLREGDRPVLHAGAGSHALFFSAGDYVSRFDLPGLRWLAWMQHFGRRLAGTAGDARRGIGPAVGIPFVDYARGDGRRLEDATVASMTGLAWCEDFRGLWGVDVGDPLHVERGPAGPKFDRRGEVRLSWADPLGYAGLHGTLPPSAMRSRVNLEKIDRTIFDLDEQIREKGRLLPLVAQANPDRRNERESKALSELLRQKSELRGLRNRVAAGQLPTIGIRDHLERPLERLAEGVAANGLLTLWAMLSIPLIMGALGASLLIERLPVILTTLIAIVAVGVIEQLLRRRFQAAIRVVSLAIGVVLVVAVALQPVLSITHYVLGGLLLAAAGALVVVNVAEWLRARSRRSESTHR